MEEEEKKGLRECIHRWIMARVIKLKRHYGAKGTMSELAFVGLIHLIKIMFGAKRRKEC